MKKLSALLLLTTAMLLSATTTIADDTPGLQLSGKVTVIMDTSKGEITLELDADKAPVTVANFVRYAKSGFYDNTLFHRVIAGFMVQGGGLDTDMQPKKVYPPIRNEADNGLKNLTGTIAMARTSDPDSATSQFFINVKDNAFLDYKSAAPQDRGYAVFGKVVDGMDVVHRIEKVSTGFRSGMQDVPVEDVILRRVTISE